MFLPHVVFTISTTDQIKLFLAKPGLRLDYLTWFRLLCVESHLFGPCAVQPTIPHDHPPGEPRDVGGAGERSRFQHRMAQHRRSQLQMIIGRLVSDLCPMSTHHHNPMRLSCPRPPSRRGRGDKVRGNAGINKFQLFNGKFQ